MTSDKKTTVSLEIIEMLERELPNWFTRKMAVQKLNGLLSYSALANYEYRKIGPPIHYMGVNACYMKDTFIQWLKDYLGGMTVTYDGFSRRVRRNKKED